MEVIVQGLKELPRKFLKDILDLQFNSNSPEKECNSDPNISSINFFLNQIPLWLNN